MHKFKVKNQALATAKSWKFKDKLVTIVEARVTNENEPYYMVTGEGILGTASMWEHELRETT